MQRAITNESEGVGEADIPAPLPHVAADVESLLFYQVVQTERVAALQTIGCPLQTSAQAVLTIEATELLLAVFIVGSHRYALLIEPIQGRLRHGNLYVVLLCQTDRELGSCVEIKG